MEKIKVCRVCLVMDVRMFNLRSYPLDTYFEAIIGLSPLNTVEIPTFACSQCAVLIQKYYFFKEKCLRGQSTLYSMLNATGKITTKTIKDLDRQYLNLTSSLTTSIAPENSIITLEYNENGQVIKTEPDQDDSIPKFNIEESCIKQEEDCFDEFPSLLASSDDDDQLSFHFNNKKVKGKKKQRKIEDLVEKVVAGVEEQALEVTTKTINVLDRQYLNLTSRLTTNIAPENSFITLEYNENGQVIKTEPDQDDSIPKFNIEEGCIKQEDDCFDDFPSLFANSVDDDPLSFHKSNNEVTGKKKEKKIKDLEENVVNVVKEQGLEQTANEVSASEMNETLTKRKRGRPKKTDKLIETKAKTRRTNNTGGVVSNEVDLEEYVTIVKLKKMDEENQIDEKLKRKRALTNARVKKYRKRRKQLNSLMQDDPTKEMQNKHVKENKAERKRAMGKERSRRFREKKRLDFCYICGHSGLRPAPRPSCLCRLY